MKADNKMHGQYWLTSVEQRISFSFVFLLQEEQSAAKMGCFGFLKGMMVLFNGIIFVSFNV